MADRNTTRVADIRVVAIKEGVQAKQGTYKGDLDVINVTELNSNKGLKINLRTTETMITSKWKAAAKVGNVLRVHIGKTDKGVEYVDRNKAFELIDEKKVNQPQPVRSQEPMKAFTDPQQSLELVNGLHYDKINRAQSTIREAMLTIKRAQQDIDDAFKAIKEDSI